MSIRGLCKVHKITGRTWIWRYNFTEFQTWTFKYFQKTLGIEFTFKLTRKWKVFPVMWIWKYLNIITNITVTIACICVTVWTNTLCWGVIYTGGLWIIVLKILLRMCYLHCVTTGDSLPLNTPLNLYILISYTYHTEISVMLKHDVRFIPMFQRLPRCWGEDEEGNRTSELIQEMLAQQTGIISSSSFPCYGFLELSNYWESQGQTGVLADSTYTGTYSTQWLSAFSEKSTHVMD